MRLAAMLLACAAMASAADITGWERDRNTLRFKLTSGAAEMEWISTSSFRIARCPAAPCSTKLWKNESVEFTTKESAAGLEIRTKYVIVVMRKTGAMFDARRATGGTPIVRELGDGRWTLAAGERLYGLGARDSEALDLRGSVVRSETPVLVSTQGYGIYFYHPAKPSFDLGKTNPAEISIPGGAGTRGEYFFYYGPSAKEVIEEHRNVTGAIDAVRVEHTGVLAEADLPRYATRFAAVEAGPLIRGLQHAAFSGMVAPAMDLAIAPSSSLQLATWVPLVYKSKEGGDFEAIARERRRWGPYLWTYLQEARDRGFPLVRPLAMQYPSDAQGARRSDAFLVGDEVLLATARSVYLPMGLWTELATGVRHAGRKVVDLGEGARLPVVLVKNGAILPLGEFGKDATIELHYFPKLAAEFFLYEPENGFTSQFHAAPAGDYMRLEIESKVARGYQWVVHDIGPLREVAAGGTALRQVESPARLEPGDWCYDEAARRLHVSLASGAQADIIVNLAFQAAP